MQEKKREMLSKKDITLIKNIAFGATDAEIAADMKVSTGTIRTYIANLLKISRTINRAHLVYWAVREGFLK